jgi:transcriptional regulator with XRE-family HTH domain
MAENRVRELRKARGLTLAQLAARMDPPADVAGLQKIETGKTRLSLPWITRISAALGVEPTELIAGNPSAISCSSIPVLDIATAGQWKDASPSATDQLPAIDPPRDAFAVRFEAGTLNGLLPVGGYLIVAPHERELLDEKVYLIVVEGAGGLATVRRFRSGSPPVFHDICGDGSTGQLPLGLEPFRVIGRVVALWADL